MVQLSHPYMTIGKTIALTRQTFGGKVMSLLFNMLSRLVIFPGSVRSPGEGNGNPQSSRSPSLWPLEIVTDFIFLGSKITADGDGSHKIKRCFLLGRKAMTNLDSILESRDVTLPTKVHRVKDMIFPVVMYGCES